MLNIPELDDMICQLLGLHDLAQCARVNKRWHSVVIPHLWRDMTWLPRYMKSPRGFIQMVVEDYLEDQQRRNLTVEGRSSHMSALSKYGHWIRLLPSETTFRHVFSTCAASNNGLDAFDLFLHLCRRCSPGHVQVECMRYPAYLSCTPGDTHRMIIDFMLPRTRELEIHRSGRTPSELISTLEQCSSPLRKLSFEGAHFCNSKLPELEEEPAEYEAKGWTSFKELFLRYWTDHIFWHWFFKRCRQVEKLGVHLDNVEDIQVLVQAMLTHMPQLTEITVEHSKRVRMKDDDVATLLSGSSKGWRRVTLDYSSEDGTETAVMSALEKHFPTLEALNLSVVTFLRDDETIRILRSCPHLQSFDTRLSDMDLKVFTDQDSDSGSLKPWECEGTLKVLKFSTKFQGRSNSRKRHGQGSEIQNGLYDRLARLTQLEVLNIRSCTWRANDDDIEYLEMTLESGLRKLSGLKKLEELYIENTCVKIGIKEAQWMVENWPRLRVIDIHAEKGEGREAVKWLRKNHPRIRFW